MDDIQLADLVFMESPEAVLVEAVTIVDGFSPSMNTTALRSAFRQTVALYQGAWKDTKGCNTAYHDLQHVTDCFLALVRLLHGAVETGRQFSAAQVYQGLVAALLHDVGYLQHRDDTVGTGAKFTASHVRRGMDFVQRHFTAFGLQESDLHACMAMIHCTDLSCDLATVPFPDPNTALIGKMLATADLMAQMADRHYLEKLRFLYHELSEARIDDYGDEVDLLVQSKDFCVRMVDRFADPLSAVNQFMRHHFRARWGIDADLYQQAIDNQQVYLSRVLQGANDDPRNALRRSRHVRAVTPPRAKR